MESIVAYIGLGSNIGNRQATLLAAVRMMDETDGLAVRAVSAFIETDPVGGPPGQDKYLNAVAEVQTTLEPAALLDALHRTEAKMGRDRSAVARWGPRTCDLDILLMGSLVVDTEDLTIPHPRMHERLFVLRPLVEIAPDAEHPVLDKTASQLLEALENRP